MSYNYNPSSQKAEEFINHEEILETLSYAEKNKNNVELIDQILAKARLRKGLSHREAAVLLDCEIPEKVEEIFELGAPDQAGFLRKPDRHVCAAVSVELLCKTDACTVPIIRKTRISAAKSLHRRKS